MSGGVFHFERGPAVRCKTGLEVFGGNTRFAESIPRADAVQPNDGVGSL